MKEKTPVSMHRLEFQQDYRRKLPPNQQRQTHTDTRSTDIISRKDQKEKFYMTYCNQNTKYAEQREGSESYKRKNN